LTSVVLCGMQTTVDNDDSYMSLWAMDLLGSQKPC
jgi:hypothetical protein